MKSRLLSTIFIGKRVCVFASLCVYLRMEFVSILAVGKHCLWPRKAAVVVMLCMLIGGKTGLCPM